MKIVLLDSHALIHRAYHALPDFATATGEPTGALYGISTTVMKLVADFDPDYMIACYDRPEKTHRHEVFIDYKGTRKEIDDALIKQLNTSKEIFEALNIPIYEKAGFEADDILGTIVEQTKNDKKIEIIIASGDMDTLQLVKGEKVKVFTLKKGIKDTIVYDEKAVIGRFGFGPELIPDYKGLRGDPSDNIPGIAGIGEKTATILITTFGTLEEMYKVLDKDIEPFKKAKITDRIVKLLQEGKEEAVFSKMLATIRRDAPVSFVVPEKTFRDGVDLEKADAVFKKFEFRTLNMKLKELLSNSKTKTGGENDVNKKSATKEKTKNNSSESVEDSLLHEEVSDEEKVLVSVANSTVADPTFEDLMRVGNGDSKGESVQKLKDRIKKEDLERVYKIESDLIPVLRATEKQGVTIDVKYLEGLSKTYHKTIDGLEKDIYKEAGREFNINSPKQLGEILFDVLGLTAKGMKKTAGGARSTKESELLKLKDTHPIIAHIIEYREITKLTSTYIDTIPKLVDENSRLHTRFIQMGAVTGRMASVEPNLQNIPIKSDLGRAIRNAFVPQTGFTFVSFDYSQFELRIAAFLSGDEKLISIFKQNLDVHTAVSSQVFNVPLKEVTGDMRRKAKVINFGILYGMGVTALRTNLGGTKEEAENFLHDYFVTYPKLAEWIENTKEETRQRGYTTTFFGRRRYFPEIKSKLPYLRASAERMAVNAPIQGTQADFIKIAMVKVDEYIKTKKLEDKVHLLIQVHDELDYEIESSVLNEVVPEIKRIMETVVPLEDIKNVPIVAKSETGENWGELHK